MSLPRLRARASEVFTINPNFYVVSVDAIDGNAAGNDTTGDGSLATPWATIQKGLDNLSVVNGGGDDGVYVRAGVYTEYTFDAPTADDNPAIKFKNSGSAGNVLTLARYPSDAKDSAIIDQGNAAAVNQYSQSKRIQGILIANGKHYIDIENLHIRNSSTGIFTPNGTGAHCSNINVRGCYIHGIDDVTGGNVSGVGFWDSLDCSISNTEIHDVTVGGVANANACGIQSYDMRDTVIANNTIYNVNQGIFNKQANIEEVRSFEAYGNIIDAIDNGIWLSVSGSGAPPQVDNYIHHNIFKNNGISTEMYEASGPSTGLVITNNTLYLCGSSTGAVFAFGHGDVSVYDNIFYNSLSADVSVIMDTSLDATYPANATDIVKLDNNQYYPTCVVQTERNTGSQTDNSPLSTVQALSGINGLADTTPEVGGVESDPVFGDAANDDFSITITSTAYQAGSDGKNIGAYDVSAGYTVFGATRT